MAFDDLTGSVGASAASNNLTTNGVAQTDFNYATVLPALSASSDAAFMARRRAITRGVENARSQAQADLIQARAQAKYDMGELDRNLKRAERSGLGTLASRGLAFGSGARTAFQRGLLAEGERQTYSLQQGLANKLRDLQRMVAGVETQAESQYAQLDWERMLERSALDRLLEEF